MRLAVRRIGGTRLAAIVARSLRPREFLIRSDGRLRYVVLSTGHQLATAGVVFLLAGWLAFSSVGLLVHGSRLGDGRTTHAYEAVTDLPSPDISGRFAAYGGLLDKLIPLDGLLAPDTGLGAADSIEARLRRSGAEGPWVLASRNAAPNGTLEEFSDSGGLGGIDSAASLTRAVAGLKRQLSKKEGERTFGDRVGGFFASLWGVVGQRNDLEAVRTDLRNRVRDLEARLAALQDSQDEIVQGLAERTRSGVDEIEKTVAMTGLDVETLLKRAAHEQHGTGGPFIPVAEGKEPEILLASVAHLDDAVQRWEKLQFILSMLPLSSPVDHYWVSSFFGERKDPMTGERAVHEGVDLSAAPGTLALSTAPGRVVFAGRNGGYGRMVEIDHGLGIHTRYGHLRSIAVKVGQVVDYRQKIGLVGSTGRSTGPHLHYEIRIDGKPHDPMKFLKAGRYVFKG